MACTNDDDVVGVFRRIIGAAADDVADGAAAAESDCARGAGLLLLVGVVLQVAVTSPSRGWRCAA
jgi:hypothetical protein